MFDGCDSAHGDVGKKDVKSVSTSGTSQSTSDEHFTTLRVKQERSIGNKKLNAELLGLNIFF